MGLTFHHLVKNLRTLRRNLWVNRSSTCLTVNSRWSHMRQHVVVFETLWAIWLSDATSNYDSLVLIHLSFQCGDLLLDLHLSLVQGVCSCIVFRSAKVKIAVATHHRQWLCNIQTLTHFVIRLVMRWLQLQRELCRSGARRHHLWIVYHLVRSLYLKFVWLWSWGQRFCILRFANINYRWFAIYPRFELFLQFVLLGEDVC